jgi:hypothetical protein
MCFLLFSGHAHQTCASVNTSSGNPCRWIIIQWSLWPPNTSEVLSPLVRLCTLPILWNLMADKTARRPVNLDSLMPSESSHSPNPSVRRKESVRGGTVATVLFVCYFLVDMQWHLSCHLFIPFKIFTTFKNDQTVTECTETRRYWVVPSTSH